MAVMDQQEHIATLCAAGTVGIAAAGFALGTEDNNAQTTTPGKRKWPGAPSTKSPTTNQVPFTSERRVVSQPITSTLTEQQRDQTSLTASLFRRKTVRELRPLTANQSDTTADSRGSSLNRSSIFRPRTADTRTTSERRDTSTGSSWLKRISIVSSLHGTSPAASIRQQDDTSIHGLSTPPTSAESLMPNKLVKSSMSQRALSTDHAQGSFLRRPVTSHQRTATLREWDAYQHRRVATATSNLTFDIAETETSPHTWRPFFERGYPRKRHSTGGVRDIQPLRTIVATSHGQPTLISGRLIEPIESHEDRIDQSATNLDTIPVTSNRQRLRRSLSSMHRASRRRYFTDPVVKASTETANGTISPAIKRSPLSPVSHASTFDIELPHGSPASNSSPNFIPTKHRFSFRKRESTAPSDPTTISSDNDTRVFTDDDSMDFQSDTAYDSLTTRATASSHSAMRPSKLDTIFNTTQAPSTYEPITALESLMQNATLNDIGTPRKDENDHYSYNHGIGISGLVQVDDNTDIHIEESTSLTPVKSTGSRAEEWSETPVPTKLTLIEDRIRHTSDPVKVSAHAQSRLEGQPDTGLRLEDEGEIDWSPASNGNEKEPRVGLVSTTARTLSDMCSSPLLFRHEDDSNFDEDQSQADKRTSIFDWSEQQRVAGDSMHGGEARPKTVHGKQVKDSSRSRSSGRKAPNQLHLRSQSVPNNRDSHVETTPLTSSKYSTWGLGHKPVSEEWSDDFEFDDLEEEQEELPQLTVSSAEPADRGSLRGVKVPQSIIDRQASVHIQFGQVQEFMLLVEELKRLRARGSALDLTQRNSKQLWEDAENIINLATINDEEDDLDSSRPLTPTALDAFAEEIVLTSKTGSGLVLGEEPGRHSTTLKPDSNPATPPHGRPRGESLAQAQTFLQNIHQSRSNNESSPLVFDDQPLKKLPFDTQDLKDLVFRSGAITRALKEVVRKAEGVSISPNKTPPRFRDPAFSQIFNAPDMSPCPPFRNGSLPKSQSAHSYLSANLENNNNNTREMSNSFTTLKAAMCS